MGELDTAVDCSIQPDKLDEILTIDGRVVLRIPGIGDIEANVIAQEKEAIARKIEEEIYRSTTATSSSESGDKDLENVCLNCKRTLKYSRSFVIDQKVSSLCNCGYTMEKTADVYDGNGAVDGPDDELDALNCSNTTSRHEAKPSTSSEQAFNAT